MSVEVGSEGRIRGLGGAGEEEGRAEGTEKVPPSACT